MTDILKVLQLARSRISLTNKKLLYSVFKDDLDLLSDLLEQSAKDYLTSNDNIKQEYAMTLKNNCHFLTSSDTQYPHLLKQIDTAPIILTIKGNDDILSKQSVAVVGSRVVLQEDISFIQPAVQTLNNADFIIISGLARGTDAIAHINSIKTGTIAVLPCGLGNCYPKEHLFIANKIIDNGGAIISELMFNEQSKQYHFTQRNRIIVAISEAVVCCRAQHLRSGTMSSANYAIKYNKSIYTHVFNGKSDGNKWLLNNGAIEIDNLNELPFNIIANLARNELLKKKDCPTAAQGQVNNNNLFSKQQKIDNANNISRQSLQNEVDKLIKYSNLTKTEKNLKPILKLCSQLQVDEKAILNILIPDIFDKKSPK